MDISFHYNLQVSGVLLYLLLSFLHLHPSCLLPCFLCAAVVPFSQHPTALSWHATCLLPTPAHPTRTPTHHLPTHSVSSCPMRHLCAAAYHLPFSLRCICALSGLWWWYFYALASCTFSDLPTNTVCMCLPCLTGRLTFKRCTPALQTSTYLPPPTMHAPSLLSSHRILASSSITWRAQTRWRWAHGAGVAHALARITARQAWRGLPRHAVPWLALTCFASGLETCYCLPALLLCLYRCVSVLAAAAARRVLRAARTAWRRHGARKTPRRARARDKTAGVGRAERRHIYSFCVRFASSFGHSRYRTGRRINVALPGALRWRGGVPGSDGSNTFVLPFILRLVRVLLVATARLRARHC